MDDELLDIELQEAAEALLPESGVVAEDPSGYSDVLSMFPNDWALIDGVDGFPEIPSSQPEVSL